MVFLINFENINFGLQKDETTNMTVQLIRAAASLEGWGRKGDSEHLYLQFTAKTTNINHKRGG